MECTPHLNWIRRVSALFVIPVLLFIPGCYERVAHGDQAVYRFAWWLGPAIIAGGILAEPVGWYLRKVNRKWGFVLMVMGPVLLFAVAPAMYSDRVVVDNDHFQARYGLWFRPTEHNVRFNDLREIRLVGVEGNRGRINYELRCFTKAGETRVVHVGDLVKKTVREILDRAKANGVKVVIEEP